MVNIFGGTRSNKYVDYVNGVQTSHKLGYPAYRIASDNSPTLIFRCEQKGCFLGAHHHEVHEVGREDITKTNYLAHWKGRGGDITATKGDKGIRGKHSAKCDRD